MPEYTHFPPLPFDEWEPTKNTLHLYAQIVGKIRLRLTPRRNHWWHVPLYVTPTGLTTSAIPYENRSFVMEFDLQQHHLKIVTSTGETRTIALYDGLSVAAFYRAVMDTLADLGITVEIVAKPFDHKSKTPFAEDTENNSYDKTYVERYQQVLTQVDSILNEFASWYNGKSSPVHLFWHSFDLAVTRFSGNPGPELPDADPVTQDAYSHEVISFGFWAGDSVNRFPAFYSYTYPEPPTLTGQPLKPATAYWQTGDRGALALLKYEDMRTLDNPRLAVLDFLQSAYLAGCRTAGWEYERHIYPRTAR